MARIITVECQACGWVKNVEVEFDDGPSYLSARDEAGRVLGAHRCSAREEVERPIVTQAAEVVKTVDLGAATPAQVAADRREREAAKRDLQQMRKRA